LENIPIEDRAIDSLQFDDDKARQVQVLGIKWNSNENTFNYSVSLLKFVSSKRSMLSVIARIFDPIGFLSSIIFYAKHQLQRVWQAGVSWDERLPPDLERIWLSFFNELHHLSLIQVPRFVNISEGRRYVLCGFVEASIQGYAAVAFLHVTDSLSNVSVSLLGSKTKLASPTKTITIPCLELCVTGLLARWLIRILSTLLSQVKIQGAYTWSDSSVVLS